MKKYSAPITEENFPSASAYLLKLCRKNIGRNRAYNIVIPLCTVLFLFLALIFSYGGIYSIGDAEDAIIFDKLKPITEIWQFFAKMLMQEGVAWYVNLAIFVVALFLIPMAVSLVLSVIFSLTAKPLTISAQATSFKEKARNLYETVSSASGAMDVDSGILGLWCAGVYTALLLAFTVYYMVVLWDSLLIMSFVSLAIGILVVFTILYFVYAYAFMLSFYLCTLACTPKKIANYANDAYEFLCLEDPEEAKLNEEKKAKEAARKGVPPSFSTDLFKDTEYYKERKAQAARNIDKYVYGYSYPDYVLTGVRLKDREALRQYLNSNAPDSVKAAAVKRYNDYHLDNFNW